MTAGPARSLGLLAAAVVAVFGACAQPPSLPHPQYFIYYAGGLVGGVFVSRIEGRADAAGTFEAAKVKVVFRRWADGRGAVTEELRFVLSKRPNGGAFFVRGEGTCGAFRGRLSPRRCRFVFVDEFGNSRVLTTPSPPAVFTYRGVVLPVSVAVPRRLFSTLDLATGEVSQWRGRWGNNGRAWWGGAPLTFIRFAPDGAPISFVRADGLTLAADFRPCRVSFAFSRPRLAYLPIIIHPSRRAESLQIQLTARLAGSARVADLTAPGQTFAGTVVGETVAGVFTLKMADLPSFRSAAWEDAAPAAWGAWPTAEDAAADEVSRLARRYAAVGKNAVVVSGFGVFAGNVLAPYYWLEVGGETVAAPGRPVPTAAIALARGPKPVGVVSFSVLDARAAGVASSLLGSKGALPWRSLTYALYRGGAYAGRVEIKVTGVAPNRVICCRGDLFGARWEEVWPEELVSSCPAGGPLPFSFAAFATAGRLVGVRRESDPPPYEFCWPAVGPTPARMRWLGIKPVIIGEEYYLARVYRADPPAVTAYYSYDGVLLRLDGPGFTARLTAVERPRGEAPVPSVPPEAVGSGVETS